MANELFMTEADCAASFDYLPLSAKIKYRLNVIDGVFQVEILQVVIGKVELSHHLNLETMREIQIVAEADAVQLFNNGKTRYLHAE